MRIPQEYISYFSLGPVVDTSALDSKPIERLSNQSIENYETLDKIIRLPSFLKNKYTDNEFYTVRYTGQNKELNAIITGHNPLYALHSSQDQQDILETFKMDLTKNLSTIYKQNEYRLYGYKLKDIMECLSRNIFDWKLVHLAADVLGKNIFMIHENEGARLLSDKIHDDSIILWNDNYYIGPILHQNKNIPSPIHRTHTKLDEIKIKRELATKTKKDLQETAESLNLLNCNGTKEDILRALMTYKLSAL